MPPPGGVLYTSIDTPATHQGTMGTAYHETAARTNQSDNGPQRTVPNEVANLFLAASLGSDQATSSVLPD